MRLQNFTYLCFLSLLLLGMPAYAQTPEQIMEKKLEAYRSTTLPLPRFASLADEKTRVRAGPGEKYPIKWVIEKQGLPVEIILEFENWRKIRDIDGQEGWVFHSLLSGQRTGFVKSKDTVTVYQRPYETITADSRKAIALEPMVLLDIKECEDLWCSVETGGFSGWLQRKFIWGVYENENFD